MSLCLLYYTTYYAVHAINDLDVYPIKALGYLHIMNAVADNHRSPNAHRNAVAVH